MYPVYDTLSEHILMQVTEDKKEVAIKNNYFVSYNDFFFQSLSIEIKWFF